MEFPGGSDNYLAITGAAHPFLSGAETFHTPSLGDEEFEIPPIPLESDPSLAVVGHFEDLAEPGGPPEPPFVPPPYGVGGLELPVGLPPGIMEQSGGLLNMELEPPMPPQFVAAPPVTIEVPMGSLSPGGLLGPGGALTTIDQSELSSQLGLSLGGPAPATPGHAPATPGHAPATPEPEPAVSPAEPTAVGSPRHEEGEEFQRAAPSPPTPAPPPSEPPRRPKPPKKGKKKKDPNEPQKPVSAYALFFRDTQAAIKGQNPNATFGEVSKIVASMWDSLGEEQKQVYKRKTEAAKKEYLKALTAYRATLTSAEPPEPEPTPTPPPAPNPPPSSSSPPPTTTPSPPPPPPPPPPQITKILLPKQLPPPGGVTVIPVVATARAGVATTAMTVATTTTTAMTGPPPSLPRLQPPPLQQMPPQPGPGQQMPPPPPLQAMQGPPKLRPQNPPPLHIKILPPLQIQPLHLTPVPAAVPAAPPVPVPAPQNPPQTQTQTPNPAETTGHEELEVIGGDVVQEEDSPPRVELVSECSVPAVPSPRRGRCVRAGCANAPVASGDWDEEFCSSECVVRHCRDVFLAWLAARNSTSSSSSVVFVK